MVAVLVVFGWGEGVVWEADWLVIEVSFEMFAGEGFVWEDGCLVAEISFEMLGGVVPTAGWRACGGHHQAEEIHYQVSYLLRFFKNS